MSDQPTGGFSIGLADIYHTLFRHKWKILILSALSFGAAVGAWFFLPVTYVSEAKLFIRYVKERVALSPQAASGVDGQVKSPDSGGYNIMNSEIEILTSRDLAEQVAEAVGPEKILGAKGPAVTRAAAGVAVVNSLLIEVPPRSSIIRVTFRHKDPEVAQTVLQQLIQSYLQKHVEIHRAAGILDEFLAQQTDLLRTRLATTEEEIRKLKAKVGVVSIEDSKKSLMEQLTKISEEIFASEAMLASARAALGALPRPEPRTNTNAVVTATNVPPVLDMEKLAAYQELRARLRALELQEQELLSQYTELHPSVRTTRELLAGLRKRKEEMEKDNPHLANAQGSVPTVAAATPDAPRSYRPETEMNRVVALEAKIKVLKTQLELVNKDLQKVDENEASYVRLVRQKELDEANYRRYADSLEYVRIEEAMGPGRVSNINIVQAATPAHRDAGLRSKAALVLLFGGVVFSLALAFLLELFLDQSVKRPIEVERRLKLPLFLWIPEVKSNGAPPAAALTGGSRPALPPTASDPASAAPPVPAPVGPSGSRAPWDPEHELRAYYEALRDRLITYFEVRNMTHKPKLVAVTGCSHGSGVSTLATGLAAVLSETGDGNVLLVDMGHEQGAAHPFYRGQPGCNLLEAIEGQARSEAQVQRNLFVASAVGTDGKLPSLFPKNFSHLVPRLKASDYDYIIFDMPPVSQTSVATRVARHMDMTLLVIEAEKDHVDAIKRAAATLLESKASMGALLNKRRSYVPRRLLQEV